MAERKFRRDRRTDLTPDDLEGMRVAPWYDGGVAVSLLVGGPCPTCDHETQQTVPVGLMTDSTDALVTTRFRNLLDGPPDSSVQVRHDAGAVTTVVVVSCRCAYDHPGAKDNFGCGASWMLRASFSVDDPGSEATLALPTLEDLSRWPEAVRLVDNSADPVQPVREAADKWQKALAGIVGTIGLTVAIGGRDGLAKIEPSARNFVTVATLIFLGLGALAAYWANQAAIGFPTFKAIYTTDDLDAWASHPISQARAAAERLQSAVVVSALAFIVGLAGLTALWHAPPATPPSPKVSIALSSGDRYPCATLLAADSGDEVKIRLPDGRTLIAQAATITAIAATSC